MTARPGGKALPRDAELAADRLVVEAEPVFDRALDEPRDRALRRLEQQAIGAAAAAREHAVPGQEPVARLALDHEQRVDRAGADDEPGVVLADLDRQVIDLDD